MNYEEVKARLATFTPDRLCEMAHVMKAAADGAVIQNRKLGAEYWITSDPIWDWSSYDYRVKPQPREIFIPRGDVPAKGCGGPNVYAMDVDCLVLDSTSMKKFVKFREVLE